MSEGSFSSRPVTSETLLSGTRVFGISVSQGLSLLLCCNVLGYSPSKEFSSLQFTSGTTAIGSRVSEDPQFEGTSPVWFASVKPGTTKRGWEGMQFSEPSSLLFSSDILSVGRALSDSSEEELSSALFISKMLVLGGRAIGYSHLERRLSCLRFTSNMLVIGKNA